LKLPSLIFGAYRMVAEKRKVLVIGGQFSGGFTARELKKQFHVTVVDAKEYFEYTPGVLRAFVKPAHFDALTFTLQPVFERKMGVKFIWGEVTELIKSDEEGAGVLHKAKIKPMFTPANHVDTITFHYCVICAGCNFNPLHQFGESLWFATIHEKARPASTWSHIDERFIEGRRRHILEEYDEVARLAKAKSNLLIVGAGFIGVEWCTEIDYYFEDMEMTIMDLLPRCLGPLPDSAAMYCSEYMDAQGIKEFYGVKYNEKDNDMWKAIELPNKADKIYICMGVKASNYFMPDKVKSAKGPGGGGWIHFNRYMQVTEKSDEEGKVWGNGDFFAVGDCNYGCIGKPGAWILPPIPKISYPGEEQAMHACVNLMINDRLRFPQCSIAPCCVPTKMKATWWPWGAGMFATSLGPHDACFVLAANHEKGSGFMVNWWIPAALQKEIIETTKVDEMKDNCIGILIWHFVHHTPCNCWGKGPCCPCQGC